MRKIYLKTHIRILSRMRIFCLMMLAITLSNLNIQAQCTFTSSFGSGAINTSGTIVTLSTCSFAGEYSTITGAVNGQTLRFTSSVITDYITIRSGSSNGPVVAYGPTPLLFANTFTGTLYAHWSADNACGTQSACRTTTVQCTSCAVADPCTSISTITCAAPATATLVGAGVWSPGSCGFSTPGNEKIYSFTPTVTGVHSYRLHQQVLPDMLIICIKPLRVVVLQLVGPAFWMFSAQQLPQ